MFSQMKSIIKRKKYSNNRFSILLYYIIWKNYYDFNSISAKIFKDIESDLNNTQTLYSNEHNLNYILSSLCFFSVVYPYVAKKDYFYLFNDNIEVKESITKSRCLLLKYNSLFKMFKNINESNIPLDLNKSNLNFREGFRLFYEYKNDFLSQFHKISGTCLDNCDNAIIFKVKNPFARNKKIILESNIDLDNESYEFTYKFIEEGSYSSSYYYVVLLLNRNDDIVDFNVYTVDEYKENIEEINKYKVVSELKKAKVLKDFFFDMDLCLLFNINFKDEKRFKGLVGASIFSTLIVKDIAKYSAKMVGLDRYSYAPIIDRFAVSSRFIPDVNIEIGKDDVYFTFDRYDDKVFDRLMNIYTKPKMDNSVKLKVLGIRDINFLYDLDLEKNDFAYLENEKQKTSKISYDNDSLPGQKTIFDFLDD